MSLLRGREAGAALRPNAGVAFTAPVAMSVTVLRVATVSMPPLVGPVLSPLLLCCCPLLVEVLSAGARCCTSPSRTSRTRLCQSMPPRIHASRAGLAQWRDGNRRWRASSEAASAAVRREPNRHRSSDRSTAGGSDSTRRGADAGNRLSKIRWASPPAPPPTVCAASLTSGPVGRRSSAWES